MDNTNNRQYTKYTPSYIKDEDAYQGQESVKSKSTEYLPMLPAQASDAQYGTMLYDIYASNALWFPATGATIKGYLGIMFRKSPFSEIPSDMSYAVDSFSSDGLTMDAVAKNLAKEVMVKYRPAVLVDFPDIDTSGMSVKDMENAGVRPYAVMYDSLQIVDWHETVGGGMKKLDYVKLKEKHDANGFRYADGVAEYKEKLLVVDGQYIVMRVLKLESKDGQDIYTQEVYIQTDSKKKKDKTEADFILISKTYPVAQGKFFNYLPIVPCSEEGMQWSLDYSLVNDLVNLNMADYKNEALYRDNLMFLARPTICMKGYLPPQGTDGQVISTGSSSVLMFDETGHSWLLGGDASQSAALVESSKGLKAQMSTIGMRSLAADPNGVESAETAGIHRSGEHGTLSSVANAVSDTMTKVLEIMQEWSGKSGTVNYEIQTDFIPTKIDATLLNTLWQMYVNGDLPLSQLLWNLKNGEVVESGLTIDDYKLELPKADIVEPVEVITEGLDAE